MTGRMLVHVLGDGPFKRLNCALRASIARGIICAANFVVDAKGCAEGVHMFSEFRAAVAAEGKGPGFS